MVHSSLSSAPLSAMKESTQHRLCLRLNATKLFPSESGHLRDYRGLAEMLGLLGDEVKVLEFLRDPCAELLHQWPRLPPHKMRHAPNLASLYALLQEIDRYDIADDLVGELVSDAEAYLQSLEAVPNSTVSVLDNESKAITQEDARRERENLPLPIYDALLLYADQDLHRAVEIQQNLEARGLKLCLKERDLLAGVFEDQATLELIADRCHRVIAIYSQQFLQTNMNRFLLSFTQTVAIQRGQRKLIPIMYEECEVPTHINFSSALRPNNCFYDLNDKLYDSVCPSHMVGQQQPAPQQQQTACSTLASAVQRLEPRSAPPDCLFLCDKPTPEPMDVCCSTQESGYLSSEPAEEEKKPSRIKTMAKSITSKFKKSPKEKNKKKPVPVAMCA